MREKLLQLIRKNRISSTEVADALGKTGHLPGITALNGGHFVAGEVTYLCTWGESNWPLHEQMQHLPEGTIVFVDSFGCHDRAIFGDLVAKSMMLYQGARAVIVNGYLRDVHRLKKENYPLWCKGASPVGCFNRDAPVTPELEAYRTQRRAELAGAILVADDSGCTVIPADQQTEELFEKLEFIELQEDIWYFCIDTLKLSTYETICEKVYLKHPELLPDALRDRLAKFVKEDL